MSLLIDISMAEAKIDSDLLERNVAYYRNSLFQIQCHNFNWDYEKIPHVVANLLIGDLRRILKCAIFLKENRILLLTDELDIPSRIELHFHGQFTISHVGHYPNLVNTAAHVIVHGFDQSILEEDVVYEFPQTKPDIFKYLPFMPGAHSTPHDKVQELVQAIESLDVDLLQQIVGRAAMKHGLEFVNKNEKVQYHDQRNYPGTSQLDHEGVLQASQVMVQQLVEKGMLKGSIPKLNNFNGDPQTTKISFHVWEKWVMALEGDYTPCCY